MRRRLIIIGATALLNSACANSKAAQLKIPVYEAGKLTQACEQALSKAEQAAVKLGQWPLANINGEAFLARWDNNGAELENVLGPIYLQSYVHPNKATRKAGEKCSLAASRFSTRIFQDPALYQRLLAVKKQPLDAISQQLVGDLEHGFRLSGITLAPAERQRAADIKQQIERLAQAFQNQLREQDQVLRLSATEVVGMSEVWKRQNQQADGSYAVGFDYPQYFPFMRNAKNGDARRRYYYEFSRRGNEKNLQRLNEIVALRQSLADLHGLASYAELATQKRMLNSPAAIFDFLAQLKQPVKKLEAQELRQLQAFKQQQPGSDNSPLARWDLPYYLEQLRQQKYALKQEQLRDYFPSAATVAWALALNEQLFGLNIVAANSPVWHKDVQYYDVYDQQNQSYLGAIYLDLYPRAGKYKHAAAFPLRAASSLRGQRPASALVTNFDRRGFTQNELETLLHELGHVFHSVLSQTRFASHSGTQVKRDFVEAPSQMLEAWARSYESLKLLKNYCQGCPAISEAMVAKMNAAKHFGQGTFYARQHLYASFDMRLASGAASDAQALWQQMESASALGHLPGSQFPGSFGHIAGGYAAGYYGYLWSEVLALDMQSRFRGQLMNAELGHEYRHKVLARGGEAEPMQLVTDFLGRAPNSQAFFEQFKTP